MGVQVVGTGASSTKIPSHLLMQVEPIRWIGGFSWWDLIIAFSIACTIVFAIVSVRRGIRYLQEKTHISEIPLSIPSKDDPEFVTKCISLIKNTLEILAHPHRATTHTATEIAHYIDDRDIINLLELMEVHEYSGTPLSISDRSRALSMMQTLRNRLQRRAH